MQIDPEPKPQCYRFSVSKSKWMNVPAKDRADIVVIGAILNEIFFLKRMLIVSNEWNFEKQINMQAATVQMMVILRLLCLKSWEAHKFFEGLPANGRFKSSVSGARETISKVRKILKNKKIKVVRDKLCAHYDVDFISDFIKNNNENHMEDEFIFYAHQFQGLSMYYGSEDVLIHCMFKELSNIQDLEIYLTEIMDLLNDCTSLISDLSHKYYMIFFESFFGVSNVKAIPVDVELVSASELRLPMFIDFRGYNP